jgi:hypothetical protein
MRREKCSGGSTANGLATVCRITPSSPNDSRAAVDSSGMRIPADGTAELCARQNPAVYSWCQLFRDWRAFDTLRPIRPAIVFDADGNIELRI